MDGKEIISHLIMRTLKVKRSPELMHPKERRNKRRFERLPINCLPPPIYKPLIIFNSWSQTPDSIKIYLSLPESSSTSSCFLLSETNRVVLTTPDGLRWSCQLYDEIIDKETKVLLRGGILIRMTKRRGFDWPNYELTDSRLFPRRIVRNSDSDRWSEKSNMDGFEMLVDDPSEDSDTDNVGGFLQTSREASGEDSDDVGESGMPSGDVTLSAVEFGEQVKMFLWIEGALMKSYEVELKMKEATVRFLRSDFNIKKKLVISIKLTNEIVPHQSHWVLPSLLSSSSPHDKTLELVVTKLDSLRAWGERSFSFSELADDVPVTTSMETDRDDLNLGIAPNNNLNTGKDASTQTIVVNVLQDELPFNTPEVHSSLNTRTMMSSTIDLERQATLDARFEDSIPSSSLTSSQGISSWRKSDLVKKDGQKPTCMVSPLSSPSVSNPSHDTDNRVKDSELSPNLSADSSCHVSTESPVRSTIQPPVRSMPCRKPGYVGLMNLGNTCFINCVIQVLANIPELKEYFLSRKYLRDINAKNPLGMGGRLASSFAQVIEALWVGESTSFSPLQLKNLIGEKQSRFNGFQQHDAEELMEFLLDGLHEDLNRVKDKLYTAHPEDQANFDPETAASLSWSRHKSMNDSFIVDLFQGQYHSKLTCPNCGKVSITFDPFSVIQVPIPKKIWIYVLVVQSHPTPIMTQHKILVEDGSNVKDFLTQFFKKNPCFKSLDFQVVEVSGPCIRRRMDRTSKLSKNSTVMLCEVNSSDSHVKIMIQQRTIQPLLSSSTKKCGSCRRMDGRLRRCTRCFRVSYCNQKCQRDDWSRHKTECKMEGDDVGRPFIISLPASSTTYSHLAKTAEAFASLSVQVVQPPGHLEEASVSMLSSSTSLGSGDAPFMDHNYSNNNIAPFILIPLPSSTNRGLQWMDTIKNDQAIVDQGDKPLDLPSYKFLMMLWSNNYDSKPESQLTVSERENCHSQLFSESKSDTPVTQLEDCFKLFKEPETLSQEQSWRCSQCRSECQAMKELSLWRLPTCLIVHLMRFKSPVVGHFLREKMEDLVQFPIRGLDISPYLKSGQPSDLEIQQPIGSTTSQSVRQAASQNSVQLSSSPSATSSTIYDLFGVINHRGLMMGGHYTSYARSCGDERSDPIGWRLFNDSQVTSCQEFDIVTNSAYVLFYRQRQLPNFTSSGPSGFQEGAEVIPRDKQSGLRVLLPCTPVSVISSLNTTSTFCSYNNPLPIHNLHHNSKDLNSPDSNKVLLSSKTSHIARSSASQNLNTARTSYPPLDRTYRIAWPQVQSDSNSGCPQKMDSCPSSGMIQKPMIISPCGSTGTGAVRLVSKSKEDGDDDDVDDKN